MTSRRLPIATLALLSLSALPLARASCDPRYDYNCDEGMSYATRAGVGFLIFALIFFAIFACGLARRRRAIRAIQAHQELARNGVAVHPSGQAGGGGVWTQHLAGGPAHPQNAYHGNGIYAPQYMAPPPGPPPAPESQYPPPPEYVAEFKPPAGPPPGHQDKSNNV